MAAKGTTRSGRCVGSAPSGTPSTFVTACSPSTSLSTSVDSPEFTEPASSWSSSSMVLLSSSPFASPPSIGACSAVSCAGSVIGLAAGGSIIGLAAGSVGSASSVRCDAVEESSSSASTSSPASTVFSFASIVRSSHSTFAGMPLIVSEYVSRLSVVPSGRNEASVAPGATMPKSSVEKESSSSGRPDFRANALSTSSSGRLFGQ